VCDFTEVLALDADATPLQPLDHLFTTPAYRESGCLFWPDAWGNWVKDSAYKLLGLDPAATRVSGRRHEGGCSGSNTVSKL
jgi:alpha-N-acetylglucosamine transferase